MVMCHKELNPSINYVCPPSQVVRRDPTSRPTTSPFVFKRLSASSTGSTRSTHSSSSLDLVPVRDSASLAAAPGGLPGKPLVLDLEQAMERLSRLQQAVESSVSLLMSFIVGGWRRAGHLEGNLPAVRQASDRVRNAVRDFLEFARGAVANAGQATDRSLQAKLGRQVGKMEEVFQSLVRSGQALDALGWASRRAGVHPGGGGGGAGPTETTEEGWMEDYDSVHLAEQGAAEQQQIKQFERLEHEVSQPINNDMSGWVPPPGAPAAAASAPPCSSRSGSASTLCTGDRQLLLFYQEQCEHNVTTVTNAVDAFFAAVGANQPPKIFVAHSKFVILSAHKLVFIGDTLSRQARSPDVRARVAATSNALCDQLKEIVLSTKTAALQYPAAGSGRDMVERVRELTGCTQQFRMVLGQLGAM
ncbi:unnamed protein product [Arctogadus glacialis]